MKQTTIISFQTQLLRWYREHGRHDLPWQQAVTPYKVWISEIMLQQTQVKTVIPYYQRFIRHFPNIEKLAKADLESILTLWAGLGYYRRAQYLHQTAILIHQHYHNHFPSDLATLQALPGIGRSTAGAIMAMGFNRPAAILDGNVKRVFSRFYGIGGSAAQLATKLWSIAQAHVPATDVAPYTQALMDLGALCCTLKQPHCLTCPMKKQCFAYQNQQISVFPPKQIKTNQTYQALIMPILTYQNNFFLEKRATHGLWGGLWCFPILNSAQPLEDWLDKYLTNYSPLKKLPEFEHTLTHMKLNIQPIVIKLNKKNSLKLPFSAGSWYDQQYILAMAVPKPVQIIMKQLELI